MAKTQVEELLKRCPSIYKLVVVAAKRAKELAEGAPKLIETDIRKITSIALEEIRQQKVLYKPSEDDDVRGGAKAKKRSASKEKKKS